MKRSTIMVMLIVILSVIPIYTSLPSASAQTPVAYVPITLTNSQTSATAANFQQLIKVDWATYATYLNSNVSNIRFYSSTTFATGTELYAWMEDNNTTTATSSNVWVNLSSNVISGSGTLTIYMAFLPTSSSWSSYWGLAPQLSAYPSAGYGKFDNGANVFLSYFNGNTPVSDFSIQSSASLTSTTDTGPTGVTINVLKYTESITNSIGFVFQKAIPQGNYTGETSFASGGGSSDIGVVGLGTSSTPTTSQYMFSADTQFGGSYLSWYYDDDGSLHGGSIGGNSITAWHYEWFNYLVGSSSVNLYAAPQLYSTAGGYSGTGNNYIPSGTSLLYIMVGQNGNSYLYYNWLRIRESPPDGVMPSASFGSLTTVSTSIYHISFQQTSLPAGTVWGVRLNNTTKVWWLNTTANYVNFSKLANGSYVFHVLNVTDYGSNPYSGTLTISGANLTEVIAFTKISVSGSGKFQAYANATMRYTNVNHWQRQPTAALKLWADNNTTGTSFSLTSHATTAYDNLQRAYVDINLDNYTWNGTADMRLFGELSGIMGIETVTSTENYSNIGTLWANLTTGDGAMYTWKYTYNFYVLYTYGHAEFFLAAPEWNISSDTVITQLNVTISSYVYDFNYYHPSVYTTGSYNKTDSVTSSIVSQGAIKNFVYGWSYGYKSISSSFSLPSNLNSYEINWTAQENTNATYNSATEPRATSGHFNGSISATSITFSADFVDYPQVEYSVSYYLNENTTNPEEASFRSAYKYSISQGGVPDFYFNSSYIYFNFTLPSNAGTSYPASYEIMVSNLTVVYPTAPIHEFSLSSQDFTYYSLTAYKDTYNISAYRNFSTAQSAPIRFSTSEIVNYYPSAAYSLEYAQSGGSDESLVVNATNEFAGETLQISNINWGDGSPVQSSPIESSGSKNYCDFSFLHQYSTTGKFTVTFLVVNEPGTSVSLSSSFNRSISISITASFTSNALPIGIDSHIYFNYSQVNVNIQTVKLYVNNILVQTINTASNSNYNGTMKYSIDYFVSETAEFTVLWEWVAGGISGSQAIQYSISSHVPTVGKWVIVNYTLGTGLTATKESIPYFYSQRIPYNVSWSYFVWQISLPPGALNITVKGNPTWIAPIISVPANYNTTSSTFTILENQSQFQVTWLAPNPVGNALIVIDYYPESAVFGLFGVTIPFNDFNTFLDGKEIYSPTQQVNMGETITINTTTTFGQLLSSYTVTVSEQTQFVSIPLNIVPLTVDNMNSSYVIGMAVSQGSIVQAANYLMPLQSETFYAPAGTYNFSFTYLNFNSYSVVKYLNLTMTLSSVSYYIITGVTLTQINYHVQQTQSNITDLVENVNITLSSSDQSINNQILNLNVSMKDVNSTIMNQILRQNTTISNIYSIVHTIDLNVLTIENNIMSDINTSMMNVTTRVLTIKSLLLGAVNSTIGYKLTFGTPSASGDDISFPVFVYNVNGGLANYSITQNVSRSLHLDYISPANQYVLEFNVSRVKAGSFVVRIYNISQPIRNSIGNNSAIISAYTSPIKVGTFTNIAAGVIGASSFPTPPVNLSFKNLTSVSNILGDLANLDSSQIGRAVYLIAGSLAVIFYVDGLRRRKKNKKRT